MTVSASQFREILAAAKQHSEIRDLITNHILGQPPAVFAGQPTLLSEVQEHLSGALDVSPRSIQLVGSGALGYSVAPDNFGRPFHAGSDLDFAVISPGLFDAAWTEILRWAHHQRLPPESEAWLAKRKNDVFWGWLSPNDLVLRGIVRPKMFKNIEAMPSLWLTAFNGLSTRFPNTVLAGRQASARLYREERHLIEYQVRGLKIAKRNFERKP